MKKKVLTAALVMALSSLGGFGATRVSADQRSQSWSVAVHIRYPDGFIYDHVFMTGVSTSELPTVLQECGKAHWVGSAVPYHCYPTPE